jgi:TRAP-type C4-dicarboxylate transport system substrate-binding protein
MCHELAPSLDVLKIPGLFQSRDEAAFVMNRLKPTVDKESRAAGFINLGEGAVGSVILFTRRPFKTLSELRQLRLWSGRDEVMSGQLASLGFKVSLDHIADVNKKIADGALDGALTTPQVALAYQWTPHLKYFMDLRVSLIFSCLMVSAASFEALPIDAQRAVRTTVARLQKRMEQLNQQTDDSLLSTVFVKQGLERLAVDPQLRAEFFDAARALRDRAAVKVVTPELLQQVLSLLAEFRAEHARAQ